MSVTLMKPKTCADIKNILTGLHSITTSELVEAEYPLPFLSYTTMGRHGLVRVNLHELHIRIFYNTGLMNTTKIWALSNLKDMYIDSGMLIIVPYVGNPLELDLV